MTSNHRTVTVIGGGLAGLSAAYDLHRAGWQVTVLEARDRVGGRVYSLRNFAHGQSAEGGGEYIEETHTRMTALARQFDLKLGLSGSWQAQSGDWASFDGRAGRVTDGSIWGFDLAGEIGRGWEAMAELSKNIQDPYQPQLAEAAERLDSQSAADWIQALDVHPITRKYFTTYIRSEYTCEPEKLSLLDLCRNAKMYYSASVRPPSMRVVGGNDLIARALAEALPDVRLEAIVKSIRILPDGAAVSYQQADAQLTVASAFVILAIPLTTARLIEFKPPLPAAHANMINEISYGAVTKVLIQYRQRFWNELGWNGRMGSDSPIGYVWHATSHIESEAGILTAYTGGEPGAKLSALSDEERMRVAVGEIEKIFPGSSDLIEHTETVAWLNEPFTRASYMALAPGEVVKHWQTLFEPAGRLFFAGEHATAIQGYMEGAVESGQRAAGMIIKSGV